MQFDSKHWAEAVSPPAPASEAALKGAMPTKRVWLAALLELWYDLLSLVWPCQCVVCEAPDRDLCTDCRNELRAAERRGLQGGGTRVIAPSGVVAFVAGPYAGTLRALLVEFKHGGRIGFGRVLGAQLRAPLRAALSANAAQDALPTLIVAVPSRPSRVRERGYRHVDLLVRRALRLEAREHPVLAVFLPRVLRATRGRTGQVGLSAAERERNAARVAVPRSMSAAIRGRRVVLVDDVITTGATVAGASRALAAAGAEVIAVVALCATERRDSRFATRESASAKHSKSGVAADL